MDNQESRPLDLAEAQRCLAHEQYKIICDHPEATKAIISVIIAMRHEGYQLIKLEKLLDKINEKALDYLKLDKTEAEIYMDFLEDFTAIIKDCL